MDIPSLYAPELPAAPVLVVVVGLSIPRASFLPARQSGGTKRWLGVLRSNIDSGRRQAYGILIPKHLTAAESCNHAIIVDCIFYFSLGFGDQAAQRVILMIR